MSTIKAILVGFFSFSSLLPSLLILIPCSVSIYKDYTTMKTFTSLAVLAAAVLSFVAGQQSDNPCSACLENSIQSLPLCQGLNVTIGAFTPGESTAYAACLCSSLDGAWIDACTGVSQCGSDIDSFKSAYAGNIQDAGLICGAQPTFIPAASS